MGIADQTQPTQLTLASPATSSRLQSAAAQFYRSIFRVGSAPARSSCTCSQLACIFLESRLPQNVTSPRSTWRAAAEPGENNNFTLNRVLRLVLLDSWAYFGTGHVLLLIFRVFQAHRFTIRKGLLDSLFQTNLSGVFVTLKKYGQITIYVTV